MYQWKAEIEKHIHEGEAGLKVLTVDSGKVTLPPADELVKYDIVLFSRTRFEQEVRDGSDSKGRRKTAGATRICECPYIGSTRIPDCHCLKDEDLYQSPVKDIHWLRIIIDEGHEFSSSTSVAVTVANSLVTAERRWVVSGTPARDRLFSAEVDLAINDDAGMASSTTGSNEDNESVASSRDMALEQRRSFDSKEESTGAARSLGLLASHFLQVRPWSDTSGERVDWDDYIFRHEDSRRRTFSAFSSCLRRTMEGLMVKTQPEDVERDITLPPLEHRVVYLEPSFHDKTIFNLFVLFLTANAVTSEREDKDYLVSNALWKIESLVSNICFSSIKTAQKHEVIFWQTCAKAASSGLASQKRTLHLPSAMENPTWQSHGTKSSVRRRTAHCCPSALSSLICFSR